MTIIMSLGLYVCWQETVPKIFDSLTSLALLPTGHKATFFEGIYSLP
jgi:hypothetical protein